MLDALIPLHALDAGSLALHQGCRVGEPALGVFNRPTLSTDRRCQQADRDTSDQGAPPDDVIRSEMAGTGRSDEPWIPQLLTTERFHPLDRDPGSGQWAVGSGQSTDALFRMVEIQAAAMSGLDAPIRPVFAESLMSGQTTQRCDP